MLEIKSLAIPEVKLIIPYVFEDDRGFFLESYHFQKFRELGLTDVFVQDNHSKSGKGVLRGLHYQKEPYTQSKLLRVIAGQIFDVAVDIRAESETFGNWVGQVLSAENKSMLYVPEGFAHGFLVLEDNTQVLYKCSTLYNPDFEAGLRWDDPDIDIKWPLQIDPILSNKDKDLPFLKK